MEKILKPFKKKKKISLDISEEILGVVDELADLSKNSRTVIIEAILNQGLFSYLKFMERTWKRYLDEEKNEKIKKEIERLLQGLEDIKKKNSWLTSEYYLENLSLEKGWDEETKKKFVHLLQDMDLISKDKE